MILKKQYRKILCVRGMLAGQFYYRTDRYHRQIRTAAEIRANEGLAADCHWDDDFRGLGLHPRGRRSSWNLDSWNDFKISRNYKKSWKDFTKHRKQWMMGIEPPPTEWW